MPAAVIAATTRGLPAVAAYARPAPPRSRCTPLSPAGDQADVEDAGHRSGEDLGEPHRLAVALAAQLDHAVPHADAQAGQAHALLVERGLDAGLHVLVGARDHLDQV